MKNINLCCILLCILNIASCSDNSDSSSKPTQSATTSSHNTQLNKSELIDVHINNSSDINTNANNSINNIESPTTDEIEKNKKLRHEFLHKKIAYGKATIAEVRQALTNPDTAALTNTMHALYSMKGHRGIYNLIFDMWHLKKDKYPELAWKKISKPPVRIALASTINRIQIIDTNEYKDYIYSFKNDNHEFHLAQVVISLGFNGAPKDIQYIKSMAGGNNHYVAQSAITALALMGGNQARDAMIELSEIHNDSPRSSLINTLLKQTYNWPPASDDMFKLEEITNNNAE